MSCVALLHELGSRTEMSCVALLHELQDGRRAPPLAHPPVGIGRQTFGVRGWGFRVDRAVCRTVSGGFKASGGSGSGVRGVATSPAVASKWRRKLFSFSLAASTVAARAPREVESLLRRLDTNAICSLISWRAAWVYWVERRGGHVQRH